MTDPHPAQTCTICGAKFPPRDLRGWPDVRSGISALIRADHPDWGPAGHICQPDLARYRRAYVESMLAEEKGELGQLERQVVDSISQGVPISQNPDEIARKATFGERAADRVASFGGSWTFIIMFVTVLVIWMMLNITGALFHPWDPYPFILLNLVLSCVAAFQAPIIMMSQSRKEAKDRQRAENDYRVNLKAEVEIRQLHEKIDHQLARQWERLAEMQQIQIEILESLVPEKRR